MGRAAKLNVSARIVIVAPPVGVVFALQRGKRELVGAAISKGADLRFDFTLLADRALDGSPRFGGEFVQGPAGGKFVYVNSGTLAGQADSCWTRRAKVGLQMLKWTTVEQVADQPGVILQARIAGTAGDGGPTCASVPLLDGGWTLGHVADERARRRAGRSGAIVVRGRSGKVEMEIRKTLYVTSRDAWRAWLTKHGQVETEVWLIYYKKHSGRPRIPYDQAVEEALCFGWIDSIVKKIDDQKFAQKFTPRRDRTKWSALNLRRLRKLIREGRMTEAGLAKIDTAMLGEEAQAQPSENEVEIPSFVKQGLMANAKAWANFRNLTPSRRRSYIQLIMDAKREETRARRLREAISLLEQSQGKVDDIPRFVKDALTANSKAWANFRNLGPSYRRHYIGWIMFAKKQETRERRLREAVSLLEQNKKLGLK